MTDENDAGGDRHDRETDEFGGPLFPERSARRGRSDDSGGALRFGPSDSGPLPHWTDPPTGEVPHVLPERDPSEDVDVWSTFTTETPVWRDDPDADPTGPSTVPDDSNAYGFEDPSSDVPASADPSRPTTTGDDFGDTTGSTELARDPSGGLAAPRDPSGGITGRREPGRIQIGTDPSGVQRRQPPSRGLGRRSGQRPAPKRPASSGSRSRSLAASAGRDLPTAVIVGLVLGALFVGAVLWRPVAVVALVVAILALAAYEYLTKITEKGYRPVVPVCLAAVVAAPLAVYWLGQQTLPLVIAFAFMAGGASFIGAKSIEAGPLPNMAVTTMGIVWVGLLGSYAILILGFSTFVFPGSNVGTDTLVLVALGVVANDVGALFVGSATGNTLLRPWISPSKSLEGLIGGTVLTVVALLVVGIAELSDTWNDVAELLILAVVISVMAPLGDLTESMFKRNLDIKDFSALVRGHGGILDRFDSFLFVLPAVYYLMIVLEPWASV